MKKNLNTKLAAFILIMTATSSFAFTVKGSNYDLMFARAQNIIEKLSNIEDLQKLSESDKIYFADMYVIELRSGKIVYAPQSKDNKNVISASDAVLIADKAVKAWQADESKTVYDLGIYLASIVVTTAREVYVLVIPNSYPLGLYNRPSYL